MNERSSFPDRPRDETERSFLEGRDYNMKKLVKTNVMRLLDAAKIAYEAKEYPVDENDLPGAMPRTSWAWTMGAFLRPWCSGEKRQDIWSAVFRWTERWI